MPGAPTDCIPTGQTEEGGGAITLNAKFLGFLTNAFSSVIGVVAIAR